MKKEIIEVPVLSPMMRALGVPCSSVTKANGFVFVAATPPVDMRTGKIVRGDIETQTEASLNAVKLCLEAAGTSFENVVMVRIYAANAGFYNAINRVYQKHFPDNFPSRSFVPVSGWFMEFDIEVEMQAVGSSVTILAPAGLINRMRCAHPATVSFKSRQDSVPRHEAVWQSSSFL